MRVIFLGQGSMKTGFTNKGRNGLAIGKVFSKETEQPSNSSDLLPTLSTPGKRFVLDSLTFCQNSFLLPSANLRGMVRQIIQIGEHSFPPQNVINIFHIFQI